MRNNKIFWVVVFYAILLLSCEMVVDSEKLVSNGDKLVVNSIISPLNEYIVVEVSKSKPIIGALGLEQDDDDIVKNAIVSISDGIIDKELTYDEGTLNYFIPTTELPIVEGRTYYLSVSHNGKHVQAVCSVPEVENLIKVEAAVEWNTKENIVDWNSTEYSVKINWNDIKGTTNFYHLDYTLFAFFEENIVHIGGEKMIFMSDSNDEQDSFVVSNRLTNFASNFDPEIELNKSLGTTLLVTDVNYYKYRKQLSELEYDNPFAEPTQLHNNIEGGLGIFGAVVPLYNEFPID